MAIVYGPVPSRRLGMSLGIDPIPRLVCTFDCIYCQLGRKRYKVHGPEEVAEPFPTPDEIADAVKAAFAEHSHIDYITFSGSGEPTLNPRLGEAVEKIRRFTQIPIALITNSSLLTRPEVFAAAASFDLVVPSLDAGDQPTFMRINRPAYGFEINAIADAIGRLARRVPVRLEVMLVQSEREVDLNSPVRPPEEPVDPVPAEQLNRIQARMEAALPGVPVVVVPQRTSSRSKLARADEIEAEIIRILAVRPCTTVDLSDSLGINPAEVGKYLARLAEAGRIERRTRDGKSYYAIKEG